VYEYGGLAVDGLEEWRASQYREDQRGSLFATDGSSGTFFSLNTDR
jgi:hypothetical protein